jgi:hypothetical protein
VPESGINAPQVKKFVRNSKNIYQKGKKWRQIFANNKNLIKGKKSQRRIPISGTHLE